jgi:hypothetical protein
MRAKMSLATDMMRFFQKSILLKRWTKRDTAKLSDKLFELVAQKAIRLISCTYIKTTIFFSDIE